MPPKAETLSADHLFSINAGTPDMVNLTTLDEESMVSNLQERFKAGLPYTLCGQICVSVNPFRWLPIYEESVITRYHNSSNPFVTQPPHVYPVAHAALTRLQNGSTSSQSILVSGESGAGKTEATKICMQYLAKVDAMASGSASARAKALTDRVLQSSPILEAFGNAQTVRNDNSSRFGKFLQLRYSDSVRQMGANIRTYLLERSRVVRPPHKEKNYHVLYALVGGATPEETQQLGLLPEDQYGVLAEGNGRVPVRTRPPAKPRDQPPPPATTRDCAPAFQPSRPLRHVRRLARCSTHRSAAPPFSPQQKARSEASPALTPEPRPRPHRAQQKAREEEWHGVLEALSDIGFNNEE